MTEHDAEALLAGLLRNDAASVAHQVRLGGKVVDLVVDWSVANVQDDGLETIEVKLHDWRRAVKQAYASGAFAGRASIAMPANRRRRIDEAHLRELGVGLIEFDENGWWRTILPEQREAHPETADEVRSGIARPR